MLKIVLRCSLLLALAAPLNAQDRACPVPENAPDWYVAYACDGAPPPKYASREVAEYLSEQALHALERGERDLAIAHLRAAQAQHDFASVRILFPARTEAFRQADWARAFAISDVIVAADVTDLVPSSQAILGEIWMLRGEPERAFEAFDAILTARATAPSDAAPSLSPYGSSIQDSHPIYVTHWIRTKIKLGDTAEARSALAQMDPGDPGLHPLALRGMVMAFLALGEFETADALAERLAERTWGWGAPLSNFIGCRSGDVEAGQRLASSLGESQFSNSVLEIVLGDLAETTNQPATTDQWVQARCPWPY